LAVALPLPFLAAEAMALAAAISSAVCKGETVVWKQSQTAPNPMKKKHLNSVIKVFRGAKCV